MHFIVYLPSQCTELSCVNKMYILYEVSFAVAFTSVLMPLAGYTRTPFVHSVQDGEQVVKAKRRNEMSAIGMLSQAVKSMTRRHRSEHGQE